MEFLGNYILDIKFGDTIVPISPQMIQELSVTLDIDRLVPTFHLRVKDATCLLGEIMPFDKETSQVTLRFSRTDTSDNLNEFQLVVKRRRPLADRTYDIEGVLAVDNLFTPLKTRALTGNIKTSLEQIATDELGISELEVGASLNYEKTILQPSWTNAFLFRYLRDRLVGKSDEGCFYCFVKNIKGSPVFGFKSIDELFLSPIQYKFIIGANPFEDFYPVSDYRIFDNSQLLSSFSGKDEQYKYFDYTAGEYKSSSVQLSDCPALSEFYLLDEDDDTDINIVRSFGHSNAFTGNFQGEVRNSYFHQATNFIHMWISTWGLENISPGDIVQVLFAEALTQGSMFIFQHSGFWMVKRAVHILSASFMTNILLTRCGIDTDLDNSLTQSKQARKI